MSQEKNLFFLILKPSIMYHVSDPVLLVQTSRDSEAGELHDLSLQIFAMGLHVPSADLTH